MAPKTSKIEDMEAKVFDTSCLEVPKNLKDAENKLPEMRQDPSCAVNFTRLVPQSYPKGSKADEITKHSIDLSFKLDLFIGEQHKNLVAASGRDSSPPHQVDNVLGELQFAFVCFLVGNVYDGFEQWKSMVNLLCNSEHAVRKYPNFYMNLVNTLYYQLNEMPLDFFTDITTSDNFLVVHLHNLFDNIREVCVATTQGLEDDGQVALLTKLNRRCEQFKNYLEQKFNFDFDQEPDEYAPVVCEETEN